MKKWLSNQSIIFKLLTTGGITILLIIACSTLIMTYFFYKSYTANKIHTIANSIERHMFLARIAENKFVQNDLNDTSFYRTGTSEFLEEYRTHISKAQAEILNLIKLWSGDKERQAEELFKFSDRYRFYFNEMVTTYRKIGFKDWGLLGEWRQAIHNVELADPQLNHSEFHEAILQLRRLEKDYLLRGDIGYLGEIKSQLFILRHLITGNSDAKASEILREIDRYEDAFEQYLVLQKKIGRTEKEGLQIAFAGVIAEMKPVIDHIYSEAKEANQKARQSLITASIFIYFLGFGLGGVVFYFYARSISARLTVLKNAVLNVGRGDLDTKLPADNTDEIGIVAEAFNKMTTDLDTITVSKKYVDQIIASMADMLIVINPEMKIQTVNQATLDVLGYKEAELLGTGMSGILNEINSDMEFAETFTLKKYIRNVEKEYIRRDGIPIPVIFSAATMTDTNEKLLGVVCLAQDNTDRKKAEEALRKSERDLRVLSSRILETQEDERKIVARELHDGIGQALTGIKFCIENGIRKLKGGGSISEIQDLAKAIPLIRAAVEETRRISMGLRPSTLDDIGIAETLFWFCHQFEGIYKTIHIQTLVQVEESRIADSIKTAIFRIVQESLNNIAKHSRADRVLLSLHNEGDHIELKIEDNGIGFDYENQTVEGNSEQGFGLTSMKERAELSGGTLSIYSELNNGATLTAIWPAAGR
jgi:PAS domain S-box-containing protein